MDFCLNVFCGADGNPDFFVTLTVWKRILTLVYFSHIHVYVCIYNTFLHTLVYMYTLTLIVKVTGSVTVEDVTAK